MSFDVILPPLLADLHRILLEEDVTSIGLQPFRRFRPAEENADWFRAWTGNPEVTGAEFRIFGQDGTGGSAALWLTRPEAGLIGPGRPS